MTSDSWFRCFSSSSIRNFGLSLLKSYLSITDKFYFRFDGKTNWIFDNNYTERKRFGEDCSVFGLILSIFCKYTRNNENINEKDVLWLVLLADNVEKIGERQKFSHICRRSGVCQTRIQMSRLSSSRSLDLPKTPLGVWKNFKKKSVC